MRARKLSGLFINCIEANDSIFESGRMVYQCLLGSERYSLDYREITPDDLSIASNYDFYFFNYHFATMAWLDTRSIRKSLPGVTMTMVLEVAPNDPFVHCPPKDFDIYCVLDPTINVAIENVFAFPRPLEPVVNEIVYQAGDVPVIGSFGFATRGKGFEHVIDAVNREFDRAVVRINIPYSTYMDESGELAVQLATMCVKRAKDGVLVIVTHDYMTKGELIKWCGANTLNCFLYDRNMPGLAATTDQAITSGRPLITSKNSTFRHIQQFIKPFPYQSLKDAIKNSQKQVKEMQEAWSPERFRARFEQVLDNLEFETARPAAAGSVDLSLKKAPNALITQLRDKIRVRTRLRNLTKTIGLSSSSAGAREAVSYSQFGEDAIVNDLFRELSFKNISYLDIGANNPKYISNTYLFYEMGFSGVLIEPDTFLCEKLRAARPRDKVLNVGIGIDDDVKEADFYLFERRADGLSTFSRKDAEHWEKVGMNGEKYKIEKVLKVPLLGINHVIETHFTECPDLVSIDVEGWDLMILQTFDFAKYSPAVFCVETLAYNDDGSTYRNDSVHEFLDRMGYFPYKETYANTIFVNKNLYDFHEYRKSNALEEFSPR